MMKIRETSLLISFMFMAFGRHLIEGLAKEPWVFYMGSVVDMVGAYASSVARALISKCVGLQDLGKVLAMISSMEALIPIGVSQLYVWIWTVGNTLDRHFWLL